MERGRVYAGEIRMGLYTKEIVWAGSGIAIERETLSDGQYTYTVIAFDSNRHHGLLGSVRVACADQQHAMSLVELLEKAQAIAISES